MLDLLASPDFPRTVALFAVAAWLSIAVQNNRRDKGTNIHLMGAMFRMDLLSNDPHLGNGLSDRKQEGDRLAQISLEVIIKVQIVISMLLWVAALLSLLNWWGIVGETVAQAIINLAIAAFFTLWTFFLCGGLYYGYWIKTPQVQQVHLTLFIISLLLWQLAGYR